MRDINFQISEDEVDELMEEIQDSSGTIDYTKLSGIMFQKVDTQPAERANHKRRMSEIMAYFSNKPKFSPRRNSGSGS